MTLDDIIKDWRETESRKSHWNEHWDDLARVMLPRRYGFSSTTVDGERRVDDIYDGTPIQAARGLANAIGGMLRPEGELIATMQAEDDELNDIQEVKDWLGDTQERLQDAINNPKARFRQATGEVDIDLSVFGTGIMFIGDLFDHLVFQSVHLKNANVRFDEYGVANGLYQERKFTVRQLIEKFREKKLSQQVKEASKNSLNTKVQCLHAILPRNEGRQGALLARNLPYYDMWIEVESKHILFEGGFHEFPFAIPRWDTSSGEDYGRSPGMIALPDADTLQAMGETILIAGQRAADPPLAVPNDGAFNAMNTFPGGLSYYDTDTAAAIGGNPFFEIGSGFNLPISREMQNDHREQVFSAFFRNVLNLPINGPQMTATEVIERKEEFIREIGPVFGRLETDYTAPMIERSFNIMLRGGGFREIPEILQGRNVKFEYSSPVKKIRKKIESEAAKMWASEMIQLAQVKPAALDLINEDELGRFSAEALGVPNKIVNGKDVIEQLEQQRQQAIQQQQEQQLISQAASIAETGANIGEKIANQ